MKRKTKFVSGKIGSVVGFALAGGAFVAPAFGGYTAITTTDAVLTPSPIGPAVGLPFTVTDPSGGFSSFVGDTPADPTITGNDLSKYHYTLDGTTQSVDPATRENDYTGTYNIYYDLAGQTTYVPGADPSVSMGTFNILATFGTGANSNNADLSGSLTQVTGPTGPGASNFRDLGSTYGNNPVVYTGTYTGTDPGVSGFLQGTLVQTAAVPEPASLGLIGFGVAALASGRRRRHR